MNIDKTLFTINFKSTYDQCKFIEDDQDSFYFRQLYDLYLDALNECYNHPLKNPLLKIGISVYLEDKVWEDLTELEKRLHDKGFIILKIQNQEEFERNRHEIDLDYLKIILSSMKK